MYKGRNISTFSHNSPRGTQGKTSYEYMDDLKLFENRGGGNGEGHPEIPHWNNIVTLL